MKNYRVWLSIDIFGNVKNIFKIEDFKNDSSVTLTILNKYKIDTIKTKIIMQKFVDLGRKFKFGHIKIERAKKISFSYQDGLYEQFVKTINDSVKNIYLKDKDFILLNNGWFENIKK
jgi:hypothetical protein